MVNIKFILANAGTVGFLNQIFKSNTKSDFLTSGRICDMDVFHHYLSGS